MSQYTHIDNSAQQRSLSMGDQKDICILIASSLPATRNALKMLLNEQSDLYVIAEAGDSHELLKKIESTCPDVVLLDWDLLDRATPILIKTICASDQKLTTIVLSADIDHMESALEAGADVFVNMGDPPRELQTTINEIFKAKQSER